MSEPRPSAGRPLANALDALARESGLPSLVVADGAGLLMAHNVDATQPVEVAALAALRAAGDPGRAEVAEGRVKARTVDVGGSTVVVGATGDTAICSAVFDRAEDVVRDSFRS